MNTKTGIYLGASSVDSISIIHHKTYFSKYSYLTMENFYLFPFIQSKQFFSGTWDADFILSLMFKGQAFKFEVPKPMFFRYISKISYYQENKMYIEKMEISY